MLNEFDISIQNIESWTNNAKIKKDLKFTLTGRQHQSRCSVEALSRDNVSGATEH